METSRHRVFQRAHRRAELSLEQLWLRYLEVGGIVDLIEVDAFLHGVVPLAELEQDMLAHVINEALDDAYRAARVPYLRIIPDLYAAPDALAIIDDLIAHLDETPGEGGAGR